MGAYGNNDVWHYIQFKNSNKQPLTTGPASVFKDGQIVGQDTLKYTALNSNVRLQVAQTLDIPVQTTDEEVSRAKNSLTIKRDEKTTDVYDLVTYKYTFTVQNHKNKAVYVEASRNFQGQFVSAEPKINAKPTPTVELNSYGYLYWDFTLQPGRKTTYSFVRRAYVKEPS